MKSGGKHPENRDLGGTASKTATILVLSTGLLLTCLVALRTGRYSLGMHDLLAVFRDTLSGTGDPLLSVPRLVVFNVRLPRILAAVLVGAALSGAGACYQGLFRNPMVEPSLLGVTAGAAFGAAIGILMSLDIALVQLTAFLSGLCAMAATMILSAAVNRHGDRTFTLILCGIVTGTLFSAFLALAKYVADPYSKLPAITYWLMGSLATVTIHDVRFAAVSITIGLVPLVLLRWRINTMAFGDDEARTLGVNTDALRVIAIVCSTLMTAAAVSVSGMIGWVGLVIPHLARMLVGPSFAALLPAAILLGALFLLGVDTLARVVFPLEIPLGIMTAIMGAPVFVTLLARGKRGWI